MSDPIDERSLAALVRRAQLGDAGAFSCLVEHYQPLVSRYCRQLVREPTVAQDLAQETLLRAQQSLPRLQQPARFGAWLCGIATNLARGWWRQQRHQPLSLDTLLTGGTERAGAPLVCLSPEQIVEEAEQARRVLTAIESLPAPLGRAVALYCLHGFSYAEVGAALQVPVSTVKSRLFHSRAKLRRVLATAPPAVAPAPTTDDGDARPSRRQPSRNTKKGRPGTMTTSAPKPPPPAATQTAPTPPEPPTIQCSFCGKTHHQVRRLIAGPRFVYICDECVGKCNAILAAEEARSATGPT